ncbi:epidermal growth factor receptor substrate 15-like 1 isoform X2 [Bacillus rossius redtenbacheri]|uniref:epidermal growth factor receptor substrate 15-like 1 isoform X2 n=1 Tax=Bacillus rossius redtenbacheri TaxID=93214 RepID=UPI002FDCFFB8
MAALPSPTQVAGSYSAIYEAYYRQVDPGNQGSVEALEAARFLKRSGLPDAVLSRIWDLSDPAGKGYLNKAGFFLALKLVSLAQSGREVSMVNVSLDSPPPKMGDVPPVMPLQNSIMSPPVVGGSALVPSSDWAVKPAERAKYDQLFDSLQPLNGMIPGNKVKGLLLDSKLPVETLGKIWDLADMDKDGMLDRHEFMVAMHLVYKALEKYTIPSVLPPELMAPPKRRDSASPAFPGGVPVLQSFPAPADTKPPPPAPTAPQWVVSAEEKARYDILFHQTDVDKDGYVSGLEIKDVFLQSGVPQPVLAHIWSLCDMKQMGKLNAEQFALAMWLINQKLKGVEPPAALAPEMVPPSFQPKQPVDGIIENNNAPYSNPELDMITRDIEELAKEKHLLESDIAQKEADIKIKNGEIKSLQSELDTLAATLKQLENQKGEAQKRLNDLKAQKSSIETELNDIKMQLEEEQLQVDNLRRQAGEQEAALRAQEEELSSKKTELEGLRQEEARLEEQQRDFRGRLDGLTRNLQDTQLQISQAKAKITDLQEQHRQMNDAISAYDSALSSGDLSSLSDTMLNLSPEFRSPEFSRIALVNGGSPVENTRSLQNSADPFSSLNGPADSGGSGFGSEDLFKNDPFKSTNHNSNVMNAYSANDAFSSTFSNKPKDSFTAADPFNSFSAPVSAGQADPFDPFGDGNSKASVKSPVNLPGEDPFGCEPFEALHPASAGPPPRPESPSPALPPKKSKQPPPRPAPPRPQQPTMRAAPVPPVPSAEPFGDPADLFGDGSVPAVSPLPPAGDPFASSGGGGFADFANFESKFCNAPAEVVGGPGKGVPPKPAARYAEMEFTQDPFKDYRYEDPFEIADPFDDGGGAPRANGIPPEDRQMAWAAAESLKLEEERRRRLRQEQADFEYALELSRSEELPKKVGH